MMCSAVHDIGDYQILKCGNHFKKKKNPLIDIPVCEKPNNEYLIM